MCVCVCVCVFSEVYGVKNDEKGLDNVKNYVLTHVASSLNTLSLFLFLSLLMKCYYYSLLQLISCTSLSFFGFKQHTIILSQLILPLSFLLRIISPSVLPPFTNIYQPFHLSHI